MASTGKVEDSTQVTGTPYRDLTAGEPLKRQIFDLKGLLSNDPWSPISPFAIYPVNYWCLANFLSFSRIFLWRFCFLKSVAVILFYFVLIVFAAGVSSSSSRAADSSALQEHHLRLITRILASTLTSFTAAGIAILLRRKRSSIISTRPSNRRREAL